MLRGGRAEQPQVCADRVEPVRDRTSGPGELYTALRDFRDSSLAGLADNERRLLTELVDRYERNGVGLPEAEQEELRGVRQRLSELMSTFKTHVVEASEAAGVAVADEAGLAGLPQSFVERCRQTAVDRGEAGYWIAYSQPSSVETLTLCADRQTRQRMYEVGVSLAGETNAEVATEILSLRCRRC